MPDAEAVEDVEPVELVLDRRRRLEGGDQRDPPVAMRALDVVDGAGGKTSRLVRDVGQVHAEVVDHVGPLPADLRGDGGGAVHEVLEHGVEAGDARGPRSRSARGPRGRTRRCRPCRPGMMPQWSCRLIAMLSARSWRRVASCVGVERQHERLDAADLRREVEPLIVGAGLEVVERPVPVVPLAPPIGACPPSRSGRMSVHGRRAGAGAAVRARRQHVDARSRSTLRNAARKLTSRPATKVATSLLSFDPSRAFGRQHVDDPPPSIAPIAPGPPTPAAAYNPSMSFPIAPAPTHAPHPRPARAGARDRRSRRGDLIAPAVRQGGHRRARADRLDARASPSTRSSRCARRPSRSRRRACSAFMLFGVPARKDAEGSEAWNPDGIGQRAIRGAARGARRRRTS